MKHNEIINIKPFIPIRCMICGKVVANDKIRQAEVEGGFLIGHKKCLDAVDGDKLKVSFKPK